MRLAAVRFDLVDVKEKPGISQKTRTAQMPPYDLVLQIIIKSSIILIEDYSQLSAI